MATPLEDDLWVTRYTKRGHPYRERAIKRMPRIPDEFLDCVVYIYPDEPSAQDGTSIGGSGFLLRWQDQANLELEQIYIVTNEHVISNGGRVVRLNRMDGKFDTIATDERLWMTHPDGDDLAIYPIDIDEVYYKYKCIPASSLLNHSTLDAFNIGPGDEIYTVGRFINHEGKQRNLPTARFGHIAQMPMEPISIAKGIKRPFPQESFLAEMLSVSGYSGSPVIVTLPTFAPTRPGVKIATTHFDRSISYGPWLLGVCWGYLEGHMMDVWLETKPDEPLRPTSYFADSNSGLMAVVPAWKLASLLDHPDVVTKRNAALDRTKKRVGGVKSKTTSGGTSLKKASPETDNPSHKEDFTALLNAATKKPKSAG